MLATFTVTNTEDSGPGSLRQAILDANANPGEDLITFNIDTDDPGFDPDTGTWTIQPTTSNPLPAIERNPATPDVPNPVILDGTTQPGFDGRPVIEIDGSLADDNGLVVTAGGSTIRGLVINRFDGSGIVLTVNGGNTIEGNFLGTDVTGTQPLGNGVDGVSILDTPDNTIGGTTAEARNLISGNDGNGVFISGSAATGNLVQGNFIGTDVTGTQIFDDSDNELGNAGAAGVMIENAPNNTIGGTANGAGNVVSGNLGNGVYLVGDEAEGNLVQGNIIGLDVTGTQITGAADVFGLFKGNAGNGVLIENAPNNIIGGTTAAARNIISGNEGNGVTIFGSAASGNLVRGNYIGTDITGTQIFDDDENELGNSGVGVDIDDAPDNTIGGTAAGAGNVISGNLGDGIFLSGLDATGNRIQGNIIGLNAAGNAILANAGHGVMLFGAAGNRIGGTSVAARNVISGNGMDGIRIEDEAASGNEVRGNYIGTNITGTVALGNALSGVRIVDAPNNVVGGTSTSARNLISGNLGDGVLLDGPGATGNRIQGNRIGTIANGTQALGNALAGLSINDAPGNIIGGTSTGARNLIAGNTQDGVQISGSAASGNMVQGNFIGTNAQGTSALPNTRDGVRIDGGFDNLIGGPGPGRGNLIAFNAGAGVAVLAGTGNGILSNSIHDNGGLGIALIDNGTNPNNLQAFPTLTGASFYDGRTDIEGTLTSAPNTTFTLQFFANIECDPSGFGEGEIFLGTRTVTTDGQGHASFRFRITSASTVGRFLTATATDPANNTSEFSMCLEAERPGRLQFSQSIFRVDEGAGVAEILIVRAGGLGGSVTVHFNTQGGTAIPGFDYEPVRETLTFAHGQSSQIVTIPIIDNDLHQPDRTVMLVLSRPTRGATLGTRAEATLRIIDNDVPVQMFINDVAVVRPPEGFAPLVFTVSLSGPSGHTVHVNFATADGTARAGVDYVPVAGTLTFAPGVTHQTIEVLAIGDRLARRGEVEFFVNLSQPRFAQIVKGQGVGTIIQEVDPFIVINTLDSGPGSLRQAMLNANAHPGIDTITFDIPGHGPFTIAPLSALPIVTDPVIIDATTQPGFVDGPVIELSGALAGLEVNGLVIIAGSSQVRGLVINRFNGSGIILATGGGNRVEGNFLGTDITGTQPLGNTLNGVFVINSSHNIVGGPQPFARNVISSNGLAGIEIVGNFPLPEPEPEEPIVVFGPAQVPTNALIATGNVIQGNLIGTDVTGTRPLGNAHDGIFLEDAFQNVIGGSEPGAGNLISANGTVGIQVFDTTSFGNVIQGNRVGTDITGTGPLGNAIVGVFIHNAPGTVIGGTTPGARNVISGNDGVGLHLFGPVATGTVIQGNLIGTDITGTQPLGNVNIGVLLNQAPENLVGGPEAGAGNVISGNRDGGIAPDPNDPPNTTGAGGVVILGILASGNVVQGNLIGTDITGTVDLGNAFDGVAISGASGNLIGGLGTARNVIAGNDAVGVRITGPDASGNAVVGNLIGTDITGTQPLGNRFDGVFLDNASNNLVGGAFVAGMGNVIAANGAVGVQVSGPIASGNVIQANRIGVDVTGTGPLGNRFDGVFLNHAPGNAVGGPVPAAANVIGANGFSGVDILGPTATGNLVQGNAIGTDLSQTINLGNAAFGVIVQDAPGNTIAGNVIANNGFDGIEVFVQGFPVNDFRRTGNQLVGNLVFNNRLARVGPLGALAVNGELSAKSRLPQGPRGFFGGPRARLVAAGPVGNATPWTSWQPIDRLGPRWRA